MRRDRKREYLLSPKYAADVKGQNPDAITTLHCSFEGCRITVEATRGQVAFGFVPGEWTYKGGSLLPGLPAGWYCRRHADAIEKVASDEDLDEDDDE